MSRILPLGTFERVPLKDAWPTESANLTPWLAEQGSIALLHEVRKLGTFDAK